MQFWDKGIMLITGCKKVSPGCKNCWSERQHVLRSANPLMHNCYAPDCLTDGKFNGRVKFNFRLLEKDAKVKEPHVYAIWNDLYYEGVTLEQIMKAHRIMADAPQHTWLIVTKRPERASEICQGVSACAGNIKVPAHMWHIVTCENQAMADKRIPELLKIPGKRGLIIEPMLEGIDLDPFVIKGFLVKGYDLNIDQVILGPENGAGKRPFNPEWADSIKAQCESAGVPYYRKDKEKGTLAWRVS